MRNKNRVQFRLNKEAIKLLHELAEANGKTPDVLAKEITETFLFGDRHYTSTLIEDIMIVRAGIEQLYRRSDSGDELTNAIKTLRASRRVTKNTMQQGTNQ